MNCPFYILIFFSLLSFHWRNINCSRSCATLLCYLDYACAFVCLSSILPSPVHPPFLSSLHFCFSYFLLPSTQLSIPLLLFLFSSVSLRSAELVESTYLELRCASALNTWRECDKCLRVRRDRQAGRWGCQAGSHWTCCRQRMRLTTWQVTRLCLGPWNLTG